MSITLDLPPKQMIAVEEIANKKQISIAAYIQDIVSQAIQEEEELSEIKRRIEEVEQGKVVYKTMDELLAMAK